MLLSIIGLATVIVTTCTQVGDHVTCTTEEGGNNTSKLVTSYQKICLARVPALQRDKYPGGTTQLMKDCEAEARDKAEALLQRSKPNAHR